MQRDDIERLVRVETKLDEMHGDMRDLAVAMRDKVGAHDREITRLKALMKILLGVVASIGTAAGIPWLAAITKP